MNYTELSIIHQDLTAPSARACLAAQSPATRAAWEITERLIERKGFGHWWHEIGPENREDIFEEIRQEVAKELAAYTNGSS